MEPDATRWPAPLSQDPNADEWEKWVGLAEREGRVHGRLLVTFLEQQARHSISRIRVLRNSRLVTLVLTLLLCSLPTLTRVLDQSNHDFSRTNPNHAWNITAVAALSFTFITTINSVFFFHFH